MSHIVIWKEDPPNSLSRNTFVRGCWPSLRRARLAVSRLALFGRVEVVNRNGALLAMRPSHRRRRNVKIFLGIDAISIGTLLRGDIKSNGALVEVCIVTLLRSDVKSYRTLVDIGFIRRCMNNWGKVEIALVGGVEVSRNGALLAWRNEEVLVVGNIGVINIGTLLRGDIKSNGTLVKVCIITLLGGNIKGNSTFVNTGVILRCNIKCNSTLVDIDRGKSNRDVGISVLNITRVNVDRREIHRDSRILVLNLTLADIDRWKVDRDSKIRVLNPCDLRACISTISWCITTRLHQCIIPDGVTGRATAKAVKVMKASNLERMLTAWMEAS